MIKLLAACCVVLTVLSMGGMLFMSAVGNHEGDIKRARPLVLFDIALSVACCAILAV